MAQANFTPVSLYYSTNAAAVPLASNLTNGELAINIATGRLYFKNSSGTVVVLADQNAASIAVPVNPSQGGTGIVNNDASTIRITGNFATNLTVTAATDVTLPTSGTLATLSGNETLSNKTLSNVTGNNITFTNLTATTVTLRGGTANALTLTNATVSSVTAALTVPVGGTGLTTLTANNVLLGNGTSAVNFVAPGASGNVLTSNGTTWISQAAASSGISTGKAIAMALIFGF
jgi:hypothetical protein